MITSDHRRSLVAWRNRAKMMSVGVRAVTDRHHPILVHMIPMRRCNLSCTYCNEYDDHSPPVPTDEMVARVDHLARLGTSMICFSGGEPMLHPDLDDLIRRVRSHGIFAELLTNGYFLTKPRIEALNDAGLNRLQISVDNVMPDEVSKKSLKVLDKKLQLMSEHATFDVNINSVLGGGVDSAKDALTISRRARELGLSSTVGIIHDEHGQLKPLSPEERAVYDEISGSSPVGFSFFNKFKDNLVEGRPNDWRCRAGSRYLYICEEGLVHYCSQQRGYPARPLLEYGLDDLEREFDTEKSCAPYCTISCVHTISPFDHWRGKQAHHKDFSDPPVEQEQLVTLRRPSSTPGATDRGATDEPSTEEPRETA